MNRDLRTVLKKLRAKRGLTQEQLAELAGLHRSYIALIETGQRKNLSRPAAKVLADALGVDPRTLLKKTSR